MEGRGTGFSGYLFLAGRTEAGRKREDEQGSENGVFFHPVARTSLLILRSRVIVALYLCIVRNDKDQTLHAAGAEGNRHGLHRPLRTGNEEATIIAPRKNRDVWSN